MIRERLNQILFELVRLEPGHRRSGFSQASRYASAAAGRGRGFRCVTVRCSDLFHPFLTVLGLQRVLALSAPGLGARCSPPRETSQLPGLATGRAAVANGYSHRM